MVDARLLTRGKTEGASIGTGASVDLVGQDGSAFINCQGASTLVIEVDMTAGAAPDLGIQVNPVEADQLTVMPVAVPKVQEVGPTLQGGHDYYYGQFDVTALELVRVRLTNNNAGTQTITRASWRLA